MKRQFIRCTALAVTLLTAVAGSAVSADAFSSLSAGDYWFVARHEITALIFDPARPDAMNAVLTRLHVIPQADEVSGNGLYVLDAADRAVAMSTLQEYGKTLRQLHIRTPESDDGMARAFSMWSNGQFSASLKARYRPSVKQLPPAVIMDFSIKATLARGTPGSVIAGHDVQPRYVSGGSALLPWKGALMSVRQTDHGFLIWLVGAD